MRLRQNEFCHNCSKYVDFEFDDVTERQIIYCPNCKHEHWRKLDEGTIVNIRLQRGVREVRIAKMPKLTIGFDNMDINAPISVEIETKKVVGQTEDGRAILENGDGEKTKVITDRRWGRDPNQ